MKRIFPHSFYNVVTLIGAAIAAISFGLILFLMVLELFATNPKPYMGIIAFVILPAFLLVGLAIAGVGMMREHRRERAGKPHGLHLPVVDLNSPRQRTAFSFVAAGGVLLLLFSAFGSFKAYEYTDSDAVLRDNVSHGDGAGIHGVPVLAARTGRLRQMPYRIRSRLVRAIEGVGELSGLCDAVQQISATHSRRRSRTCALHRKHANSVTGRNTSSARSFRNTPTFFPTKRTHRGRSNFCLKIGGGNVEAGPTSGIHWHMNISNEITYLPSDSTRQVIPWVRSKRPDGTIVIYKSTEVSVSDSELAAGPVRRMDCIDCHNRPTHVYRPPKPLLDQALSLGWIDSTLPW